MPPDSPGTVNGHELNVNIGEYRERERVNELNTLGVFSHEQPMSITPKLMTNPEINLSSCCCWLVLTVCCCCSGARNQGCTGTLCLPVTLIPFVPVSSEKIPRATYRSSTPPSCRITLPRISAIRPARPTEGCTASAHAPTTSALSANKSSRARRTAAT